VGASATKGVFELFALGFAVFDVLAVLVALAFAADVVLTFAVVLLVAVVLAVFADATAANLLAAFGVGVSVHCHVPFITAHA